MDPNEGLETLKQIYFTLDQNFNTLMAVCETDAQKDQLRWDYAHARDNFTSARGSIFHEDEPSVQSLITGLRVTQQQIEQSLADLKKIVTVLQLLTSAVNLGSRLVMQTS